MLEVCYVLKMCVARNNVGAGRLVDCGRGLRVLIYGADVPLLVRLGILPFFHMLLLPLLAVGQCSPPGILPCYTYCHLFQRLSVISIRRKLSVPPATPKGPIRPPSSRPRKKCGLMCCRTYIIQYIRRVCVADLFDGDIFPRGVTQADRATDEGNMRFSSS